MEIKGVLTKQQLREFVKENDISSIKQIQALMKSLFKEILEEALVSELDEKLGYDRSDIKNKQTKNSRNGYSRKTVSTEYGDMEIQVPRDRLGEFDPAIVKKNQTNMAGIEDQIIALYAKGVSVRDIQDHLFDIYGIEVSPTLVSNVTHKMIPLMKEWQNRPLQKTYAIVYMDAIDFKVKQDGQIMNKAAYIVIGVDLDGDKDVLGI